MSKKVIDQNEPMQTRRRARKASRLRNMLTALENRVVNLEETIGNMKETLELVEGCTDGFDSIEKQLRDFVLDSLGANAENMNELVDSTTEKLAERDENLEDMVLAMKNKIEELRGELTIYKAALSNGMLSSRPKQQVMDVLKLKKFKGARFARDVDNFWWEMSNTFERWASRMMSLRQGITKLTIAMAEAKSFVELGPTKDKFESFKPNGKGNGERNYEADKERHSDDGNSTNSISSNWKPRDVK
ncbi:hypothetical protein J1N35_040299 [Gossypium stocksii]|uniref:Uncharacterized protein n=1 Tax=Gossypium stocksii TaxID=47602 RepID=A0A9D3UDC0_9ROSI|nr:hypothetical protein J1N35_040299 [Gossypium stocksii]